METQQKKSMPKSTKICITIIVLLLVSICIGGYYLKGYAYNLGYDRGYVVGEGQGYADGLADAKEKYANTTDINYLGPAPNRNDESTYLTTDTAPEGTVWTTPSGSKYHNSGCQYIDGRHDLTYYLSAEEAESIGYTPCSVCH